ncbi:MAG: DUF4349 domain-containing protein [Clostridiaceae bacterium]|jgi:hypothetical protein|nr:DUF4349 domain-containing protein [Clostridiaceae bacterium]
MKNFKKALVIALAMLIALTALTGCGSKKAKDQVYETTIATTAYAPKEPAAYKASYGGTGSVDLTFSENLSDDVGHEVSQEAMTGEYRSGIAGTGYTGSSVNTSTSFDILAQRKIIRNANISLEVDDFYKQYGNIQSMIAGIGYVQEINTSRQYYDYKGERKSRITGNITIRVDAKQFDNILNGIKGLGDITDDRVYANDITDQFFDTEGRLKILKIEYEFLEEYMMSLKDPDSIFKTRMRMTDLQTEIERLTGTLNKWKDLVELSTIYIQMTEKYPEDMGKNKNTYWDRLKNAIENSITGIVEALGNLLIFIIEAIPTLVVLAVIGFTGWGIVKRYLRKKQQVPVNKE